VCASSLLLDAVVSTGSTGVWWSSEGGVLFVLIPF